jgi:hypothetical protein
MVKISQPLITWQCTGSRFRGGGHPISTALCLISDCWRPPILTLATNLHSRWRLLICRLHHPLSSSSHVFPNVRPSLKYLSERSRQNFTLQPRRLTSCASGDNCNSTYPTKLQPDLDRGCWPNLPGNFARRIVFARQQSRETSRTIV